MNCSICQREKDFLISSVIVPAGGGGVNVYVCAPCVIERGLEIVENQRESDKPEKELKDG